MHESNSKNMTRIRLVHNIKFDAADEQDRFNRTTENATIWPKTQAYVSLLLKILILIVITYDRSQARYANAPSFADLTRIVSRALQPIFRICKDPPTKPVSLRMPCKRRK